MTPPTVQFIPEIVSSGRYSVSGDLGSYSSTRFAISNAVESGSDYDWWTRYPYGEFRIDNNSQLRWILLREGGNPYANVAAFRSAFALSSASITVNGSPVITSSVYWTGSGTNLEIFFIGSGYTALWSTFSVGDPVSLSLVYS